MEKLKSYNGSVKLMSGITQFEEGDYPLVEANAVQVDEDGNRLDDKLNDIDTEMKNYVKNISLKDGAFVASKGNGAETTITLPSGEGGESIAIDDYLDTEKLESTNPVQNKVIAEALKDKLDLSRAKIGDDLNITEWWGINIYGSATEAYSARSADKDSTGCNFAEYTKDVVLKRLDDGSFQLEQWSSNGKKDTGDEVIATPEYVDNVLNNSLKYYGSAGITSSPIEWFTYETDSELNTAIITGFSDIWKESQYEDKYNIVIPYSINGISVNIIGDSCFDIFKYGTTNEDGGDYIDYLKSVILPNTIEAINYMAFHSQKSLFKIVLPDSVTTLGGDAFTSCTNLTLVIPDSVTTISGDIDGVDKSPIIICSQDSYAETYAKTNGYKYAYDFVYPSDFVENLSIADNILTVIKGDGSESEIALPSGGEGGSITVDDVLSITSTNPVQNKVVKAALDSLKDEVDDKSGIGHTHKINELEDYVVDDTLDAESTNPVQNKVVTEVFADCGCANTISSTAIRLPDMDNVSSYELSVSDPTAKLYQYSKNMIPFPYKFADVGKTYTEGGVNVTVQEDGGIKIVGTYLNDDENDLFIPLGDMPQCVQNMYSTTSNASHYISPFILSGNHLLIYDPSFNNTILQCYLVIRHGMTYDEIVYPQFEIGDKPTAYEKYLANELFNPIEHTPNTDGTVNANLKAFRDWVSLVPDRDDVQITLTYRNNFPQMIDTHIDGLKEVSANAVKHTATGYGSLIIDDASPLEHTAKLTVTRRNLIPYPYFQTTKDSFGITFTDNGDGTITINGTATGSNAQFKLSNNAAGKKFIIKKGTYYFSCPELENRGALFIYLYDMSTETKIASFQCGNTFTVDEDVYGYIYISVSPTSTNKTFNNVTIHPQLEMGDTANDYLPYVDLSTVKLHIGDNEYTLDNESDNVFDVVLNDEPLTIAVGDENNYAKGAILTCSYNRDINKELAVLKQSNWNGKTLLTYGDSITAMGNGNSTDAGWQKYVCEHIGFAKHYGRGIGAQTFTYNAKPWFANSDGSFNSRDDTGSMLDESTYTVPTGCTAHYGYFASWDRITTMIPDDIKNTIDVIFMFGVNDAWNVLDNADFSPPVFCEDETIKDSGMYDISWEAAEENTLGGDFDLTNFTGAVASTIMKLQARCPNAMIVIGTPWSGRYRSSDGNSPVNSDDYPDVGQYTWNERKLIKEIANYFSIPCVDIWANSGVNPFNRTKYNQDDIHPYLTNGKKALARAVISGFMQIYPKID